MCLSPARLRHRLRQDQQLLEFRRHLQRRMVASLFQETDLAGGFRLLAEGER
jgi:hypothetical protein